MSGALLLDTHTLIWALLAPERIPVGTRDHISDPATTLLVSAASAWEIGTKFRMGKLPLAEAIVHGYADHLAQLRARELPVSSHHALTAGMLRWDHRDPFDRIIAAQCVIESVPLCTADPALAAFPALRAIW